ncbi:MAG: ABC transporter substrate-binding protein, partial [Bacteroidota bacterium]
MKFSIPNCFFLAQLILLSACHSGRFENDGRTVFRYNESAGITSLDPAFARNQANIWVINQMFNGLVQFDDHLKVKPCIAKSWEISPDGLTYTFHLRSDVFFHPDQVFKRGKGRKAVASDFVYTFNRLLDDKLASPGAWVLALVKKENNKYAFFAQNDSILTIRLQAPFPPFLGLLSMQYCSVVPHE